MKFHRVIWRQEDFQKVCEDLGRFFIRADLTKGWEVIIRPYRRGRSLAQNKLLWKWIDTIRLVLGDHAGKHYRKEDIHEFLATEFLPTRQVEVFGQVKQVRTSTASLKVGEFSEYLNRVEAWAVDHGIELPHPDELYLEAMGYETGRKKEAV